MAENVLTPHFKILNLGNLEERVGDKVCIVSAHTSRCISMNPDGTVTTSGNPEQRAEWRVLRDGDGPNTLGPVVGFKNVETGLFLAIKGKTVIGDECNSEHCKFIAQTDQTEVLLKKSSNPFFSLGVNADDQPVRLQWESGDERSRFYIIDCYQFKKLRAHNEEQAVKLQPEAKFVLTSKTKPAALRSHSDLESKTVYIVSEETSQPIMMMRDGSVNANGGLTTASLFRVQRLGPAFGFQSVACCDFLAIKDGLLTHGNGDGDCRFSVEVAQTATWLKKHNNTSMRVGFNADGRPVNANNVGDGQARVWIFDAARVHFQAVPSRQPQTEKEEQGDDSPQASSRTDPQPPQIQQQQGQEDMRPQRNDHAHSEQPLVPPANSATYRQQYPISQANIQAHAQHPNQPYIPQSHNYCSYPSQPPAHGHGIPQAHAYMPHSSQTQLRAGHPHPQHLAPAHYVGHVLPGQPCVLQIANADLHLHVQDGSRDGHKTIAYGSRQHAVTTRQSQFVFIPTGRANTFIIKVADENLFLHAWGGSQQGASIKLHGDEAYARSHDNSQFEVIPHGGTFALRARRSNLCIHAFGGSKAGAEFKLHGNVEYARKHSNSQFLFVPV